jgi:phospholipid/cholesterol/gamma-HCH transport system substrate-binding protein
MAEAPLKRDSIRRQVLAVLALGVVLALLLAGSIAARQGVFARTAEVYFLADTAAGISPGISVRISGFRVGQVSDVTLQPDLKVKVTMKIEDDRFASLHADANAEWFKEQLQAAIIELHPGSASAKPLSRNDPRVTHNRRRTLTEVANDLRTRLAPILDDVKQLSGSVAERKGDIAAMLANANTASQELAGASQELRALAGNVKTRVATLGGQAQGALGQVRGALGQAQGGLTQLNQTLVRMDGLVGQADKSLTSVNERLPALLTRAGDTLEQLNAVARDVKAVSGAASASVPSLLRSAAPLVDDARDMVSGVKTSWPVRNMLAPPPSALLPIDSNDAAALRDPARR